LKGDKRTRGVKERYRVLEGDGVGGGEGRRKAGRERGEKAEGRGGQ
jgi:hypothetical protein